MSTNFMHALESRTLFSGHVGVDTHSDDSGLGIDLTVNLKDVADDNPAMSSHLKSAVANLKGKVRSVLTSLKSVKVGTLTTELKDDLAKVTADVKAVQAATAEKTAKIAADVKAFATAKTDEAKAAAKEQLKTDRESFRAALKKLTTTLKADVAEMKKDAQATQSAAKKSNSKDALKKRDEPGQRHGFGEHDHRGRQHVADVVAGRLR